tara:strand:+ start:2497 stop:4200 length:1704 start_codon:yes stop_codon:yes gene_type:complete
MAYFKRDRFSGIAPGVSPRLLAEQFAQLAENIDFESGRLNPVTDESDTFTLANSTRRSIFFYRDTNWLQWDEDDVSVVEGPIPADTLDRLYWTGQDYPRIGVASTIISGSSYPQASFRLGVPAPANAPTTSKTGTPDSTQTPDDVSYVYTFVTAFGEEGPPSLASTSFERTNTETVTIQLPSSDHPSGNYNFGAGAKKRVYRSNTGSTSTQFQFLAEVPFTTTSVSDTTSSFALGEVLPSGTWIGPPDDDTSLYPSGPLQGLIAVANGVFAGFTGKRLCLTEPFLPHAWPIDYRITLEEDIVAIGSVTNGIVALTDGAPYFVTGIDPSAMTAVKLDIAQACINKRSVVDMGDYLLYAGPDGLVAVSGGEGQVVTNGLISPKQWNDDFNPTTYRAFRHENTYVAFYSGGGFVYDPRAGEAALSTISYSGDVRGGYMHDKNGELYIIVGNKIKKYRGGTNSKTLKWKSKQYVTPKPVSMGWVSVHAQAYPVTVKVWADGVQIAIYTISFSNNAYTQSVTLPSGASTGTLREPIMRLPAVVGQVWEVQVEGSVQIDEVCLAQSMDEIAAL